VCVCVCVPIAISIIRQGRCTLVTTLQMFQILALNCLVSAYSMSVLYLDGFKSGDVQMTVTGVSIAMFFLLISWSKPVEELSKQKPHAKLFTVRNHRPPAPQALCIVHALRLISLCPALCCSQPHMFFAVMGQFALHMGVLLTAVSWANPYVP
jgi:cation-transporting ATPase 13A1